MVTPSGACRLFVPGLSGQEGLVLVLEARGAVAVPVDRAHDGQGQLPVGLDPLGFGHQIDAGQVEGGDLVGRRVGHAVGQVHEARSAR